MNRTQWAALTAVVLALLFAGAATVATAGGPDGGGVPATPATDSADAGFARDMAVHHQQAVEMSFIVRDRTRDEEVRRLAYDIANTQANQRGMMLGWLDLWGLPKTAPDREPMAWMSPSTGGVPDGHSDGNSDGDAGGDSAGGSSGGSHGGSHGASHGGSAGGGAPGGEGRLMPGMATKAELKQLAEADGRQAEILYLQLMTDHHKGGVHMAQGCADTCRVGVQRQLAQGMVDAQQSELALMADLLARRGAKPRG
ncbi:DUF305 domain-containing protein [Streptomyces sp. NPDC047928]|uniref:DUF305 domain-containing protein n=1 Tax=unclassified Streptomyces TaxID=2593676 RepID=UPI003714AF4C